MVIASCRIIETNTFSSEVNEKHPYPEFNASTFRNKKAKEVDKMKKLLREAIKIPMS